MSQNTSDPTEQNTNSAPKLLSCSTCRQRKIKCNKTIPCLPCERAGHQCVYPTRARKRRDAKRSGTRDAELLNRLNMLESLVSKMHTPNTPGNNRMEEINEEPRNLIATSSLTDVRSERDVQSEQQFLQVKSQEIEQVGETFWTNLSSEVGGIRELLEDNSDEDEEESMTAAPPNIDYTSHFIFNDPRNTAIPEHPISINRPILFHFYYTNVHPLCKILHWPTISAMLEGHPTGSFGRTTRANESAGFEAVTFAIYFASVTSMSPEDCLKYFRVDKFALAARYKRYTEAALSHADFLRSNEILTLQALVLYIIAVRSHDLSRSSWTLIGLAVRIAHALNLHRDGSGEAFTAYDAEIRRRLWWQILVLDGRASEDRGTEPMILDGSFDTELPRNLNDDDFGPESVVLPPGKTKVTEMAFCLISMDVSHTLEKMNFIPPFKGQQVLSLSQKEELVNKCAKRIDSIYLGGTDISEPSTWVISIIGRLLVLRLWLAVQYPLERHHSTKQSFEKGQSLRSAVAYLNLHDLLMEKDSSRGFLWFFETYVPWHAVAVILAELCKETQGPLVNQAWSILDRKFEKWGEQMADSKGGVLWRPVKRLMKKARDARTQSQNMAVPTQEPPPSTDLDMSLLGLETSQNYALDPNIFGDFLATDLSMDPFAGFILGDQTMAEGTDFGDQSNWNHWSEFVLDVGAAKENSSDSSSPDLWMA